MSLRYTLFPLMLLLSSCSRLHTHHRDFVCGGQGEAAAGCVAGLESSVAVAQDVRGETRQLVDAELSCGPAQKARYSWEPNPCSEASDRTSRVPYRLAVIEFDDYGDLWASGQFRQALDLLKAMKDRQVLFVGFVHGWKHNAAAGDTNLEDFRKIVRTLGDSNICPALRGESAAGDEPQGEKSRCAIFAVYFSWRGDSIGLGQASNLSFFNRKAAARRSSEVPSNHIVVSLLGQLFRNDRERLTPRLGEVPVKKWSVGYVGRNASRSIIIGHSFGGRFLESALAQSMVGRQEALGRIDVNRRLRSLDKTIKDSEVSVRRAMGLVRTTIQSVRTLDGEVATSQQRRKAVLQRISDEVVSDEKIQASLVELYKDSPHVAINGEIRRWSAPESALGLQVARIRESIEACRDPSMSVAIRQSAGRIEAVLNMLDGSVKAVKRDLVEGLEEGESQTLAQVRDRCKSPSRNSEWVDVTVGSRAFKRFQLEVADTEGRLLAELYSGSACAADEIDNLIPEPLMVFDKHALSFPFDRRSRQLSEWRGRLETLIGIACGNAALLEGLESEEDLLLSKAEVIEKQSRDIANFSEETINVLGEQISLVQANIELLLADTLEVLRPPVDAALLVNPATEGLRGEQLANALAGWKSDQRKAIGDGFRPAPFIIQVAGWADDATGWWLPQANRTEDFFARRAPARDHVEAHDGSLKFAAQSELARKALPQIGSALTHCISTKGRGPLDEKKDRHLRFVESFVAAVAKAPDFAGFGFSFDAAGQEFTACPVGKVGGAGSSPQAVCGAQDAEPCPPGHASDASIWVMAGDEAFISDHNDVLDQAIGGLAGTLIRRSSVMNLSCAESADPDPTVCKVATDIRKLCDRAQELYAYTASLKCKADALSRRAASTTAGSSNQSSCDSAAAKKDQQKEIANMTFAVCASTADADRSTSLSAKDG